MLDAARTANDKDECESNTRDQQTEESQTHNLKTSQERVQEKSSIDSTAPEAFAIVSNTPELLPTIDECKANMAEFLNKIRNFKPNRNKLTTKCYQLKIHHPMDDDVEDVVRKFYELETQPALERIKLIMDQLDLWGTVQRVNPRSRVKFDPEEPIALNETLVEYKADETVRRSSVLRCTFEDMKKKELRWEVGDLLDIEEDICDVVGKVMMKVAEQDRPSILNCMENAITNIQSQGSEKEVKGPRKDLQMRHYESVVERLSMIGNRRMDDSKEMVTLDKRVEYGKKIVKSHPIAIYLNKSALRSMQSTKINQNLIYERMASFSTSNEIGNDSRYPSWLELPDALLETMDNWKIDPRKRWNKLYDRNSIHELLSAEILTKITQLRNVQPVEGPVKYRNVDSLHRKYKPISRILIYRRIQRDSKHGEGCFPSIWNEPSSSNVIDEVSGENLCHITLLCRDVLCECNSCTTGCTGMEFSCGMCYMKLRLEIGMHLNSQISGSVAENCMPPIFYLQTDGNDSIQKCSDLDLMIDLGLIFGFDVNDPNTFATVDTDKSRPGYLRLRKRGTGQLWCYFEEIDASRKKRYPLYSHGPAISMKCDSTKLSETDHVPYLSCSSWPPIAKSWIDRKRPSNWPSKETIQTIVSKGCRVVPKPHGRSGEDETEWRFSFSEAEGILFGTLTCDQRKCFTAFKALIKYIIYKLEDKSKEEINLSTYCLKTIFLWACETIPVDHWHTTDGWSKCLLYMIDNLYISVKARQIPGYFIPECNLSDTMKQSDSGPLLDEIETLRCHPISNAAIFIKVTKCFRGFRFNICDEINILCSFNKIRGTVLTEQLIFLQRIVAKTNVTRVCLFWIREAVLRIFAKWCKQNSNEMRLALWQCLTTDMTLFDVVYLDIVHGFDVPNHVLLKYVDQGWSAEFVCRLASCYTNIFDQGEERKPIKYSNLFKSFLMTQHAFDRDCPTISAILVCILTLMKQEEFDIAIRALESGSDEMLKSEESICLDDLDSIVSNRTRNEFREMTDLIKHCELNMGWFRLPVPVLFRYFSWVCYKNLGQEEKLCRALVLFLYEFKNHLDRIDTVYSKLLLLLEVFEHSSYDSYVSLKMHIIELVAFKNMIWDLKGKELIDSSIRFSIVSCSWIMRCSVQNYLDAFWLSYRRALPVDPVKIANSEKQISCLTKSTADIMYYVQVLAFNKHIEKAISILNSIVDGEGDYSLSVFICPKSFWESNFLDDNLRKELSKSSAEYVVFPTNLYARYLLVNAYNSLGQMEQCERNKTEFRILRQRYSSFKAFAPMMNMLSNIFE